MTEDDDLFGGDVDPNILNSTDDIPTEAWAKTLVRVIEVQESAFKRSGMSDDESFRCARLATLALANYMGGGSLYIPRGDALKTAIRDAEIFRDAFRGNVPELARQHKVSERHIWRILNRQQRLHIRKLQPDMFE